MINREEYQIAANAVRADPYSAVAAYLRRLICQWHIKHGGMPPHDLRADWPNVPSWAK